MARLALVLALALSVSLAAQSPQDYVDRAVAAFERGRHAEALAAFDDLIKLIPDIRPELWQRGIILYDLGRYKECAAQFADFHALTPGDVENAAWHFFCTAKAESPAAARTALFKAGSDARVMRAEIYAMLTGALTPEEVIDRAEQLPIAEFYAHLYVGMYLEVQGQTNAALEHLNAAADPSLSEYGGFMNIAARVHRDTLTRIVGK